MDTAPTRHTFGIITAAAFLAAAKRPRDAKGNAIPQRRRRSCRDQRP